MAQRTKNYNPALIAASIVAPSGVHVISGWGPTVMTVARRNPSTVMDSGADAEVVATVQNDKTGLITFTLQASAESNAVLSEVARLQEIGTLGPVAISIKDLKLRDLWITPDAMIETWPGPTRDKNLPTNVWGWVCGHLEPTFLGAGA